MFVALVCLLATSLLAPSPASAAQDEIPVVAEYQVELPAGHLITSAALARDGLTIVYTHARADGSSPAVVLMASDSSWSETAPAALASLDPIDSRMISNNGGDVVFLADNSAWVWDLGLGTVTPFLTIEGMTGASISGDGDHLVVNYPDGIAYRVFRPTGYTHGVGNSLTYVDELDRIISPFFTPSLQAHVNEVEIPRGSWRYNERSLCPEKIYRCNDGAAQFLLGQNTPGMIGELERGVVYLELTRHMSGDDHFVDHDRSTITRYDASNARGFLTELSLDDMIAAPGYGPEQAEILRLYQAYFDRVPDYDGVKYWLRIQAQRHDVRQVAGWMSDQEEFTNTYEGTTNDQYVEMVYSNVLGRDFDEAGYQYWLGLLDAEDLDRAGVVYWITRNAEFIVNYPFL